MHSTKPNASKVLCRLSFKKVEKSQTVPIYTKSLSSRVNVPFLVVIVISVAS